MASRDELLSSLDPAIRKTIEEDDRYAPMIALFAAWKEEIDGHLKQIETNVVNRLAARIFPQGAWRFPAQTLAVPEDGTRREVGEETEFTDRATQTRWTPCGPGWTLPTRLTTWSIEQEGWDRYALVCNVEMDNRKPDARLLTPPMPPEDPQGTQQLAFVAAKESIVADLAAVPWAVQHPGVPFQPIGVSRYTGYLDFERGLGAARSQQRQLEVWLPPFYPYSRKFLRFFLPPPDDAQPSEAWKWLGESRTVRLAALISEKTADALQRQRDHNLVILNAIPVAQMRSLSDPLLDNPDRVGESYRVPFMGVTGCFAASMREYLRTDQGVKPVYYPCRLRAISSEDPRKRPGFEDVEVDCDRTARYPNADCRVRIYYDSFGEKASHPNVLSRPGMRYAIPFPALGSLDAPIVEYGDAGAKMSWYKTLLRSPQLTEGDLLEILSQLPDCKKYLELDPDFVKIQLDIDPQPWIRRTPWDSYIWPTIVSEASLLEQRATYLTKSRTAIVPIMRLIFNKIGPALPEFLVDDLLRYVASVVSMHFMIGWYRVESVLGDSR